MKTKTEKLFAPLYKEGQFVSIKGRLAIAKRNRTFKNPCRECQEERKVVLVSRCDLCASYECTTKLGIKMYPSFIRKKK